MYKKLFISMVLAMATAAMFSGCGGASPQKADAVPPEVSASVPEQSSVAESKDAGGESDGQEPSIDNASDMQEDPSQLPDELPAMTAENQAYCDQYITPVLVSGMLNRTFSPEDYSQLGALFDESGNMIGGHALMYCFEDLTGQEKMQQYWQQYDGVFPAALIEDALSAYFEMTVEQMRETMSYFYDASSNVYRYEGGRGSPPVSPVVTQSRKNADLLELDYSIYSDEDSRNPLIEGTLCVRETPDGFHYISNRLKETEQ